MRREHWGTRIGLILAMAGNAIGLGNFLRFPVQAAKNGGGAFMIPYFISFILLGIPLMWVEWTIGRYGGVRGHGSTPGMFDAMWRSRAAKFIGVVGIFTPLVIAIYYVYIESWTLAYSIFSFTGGFYHLGAIAKGAQDFHKMLLPFQSFFNEFTGMAQSGYVIKPAVYAYLVFVFTLAVNIWVIYRGISAGIERLAKLAMPLLFIMAVILMIRVLTLGQQVPGGPTPIEGLAFLWEPDFSQLTNASIWLAAAGQIFFTLSLGTAAIHAYASYLSEKDDIVLSGLTTSTINEFAEIVLGASIAIPAAVVFFGVTGATEIAESGAFTLGFITMPSIFSTMKAGAFFGGLWFGLLFFAGITSSVALSQPAMAFLEDEFGLDRKKSAYILGLFIFVTAHIPIFLSGALDEMDFWAGTFGLVFFATLEILVFILAFGIDRGWEEMHKGAQIQVPKFFKIVIKYITPTFLLVILAVWITQDIGRIFSGVSLTITYTRVFLLFLFLGLLYAVKVIWSWKEWGRELDASRRMSFFAKETGEFFSWVVMVVSVAGVLAGVAKLAGSSTTDGWNIIFLSITIFVLGIIALVGSRLLEERIRRRGS